MNIVHTDVVVREAPGTTPDYNRANPLLDLLELMEKTQLAAEREYYGPFSLQYLFPFKHLELHGPAGDTEQLNPALQDGKTDFQKQNVHTFLTADTQLVRGLVTVGSWTGPFLRISYRGGPDTPLWDANASPQTSQHIKLWLSVNGVATPTLLPVPYNDQTKRYEIELWGYPKADLPAQLDVKGQAALASGELLARPDLIQGSAADFERGALTEKNLLELAPFNAMHPLLPLRIALAWANDEQTRWDSQNGANYHFEFNMRQRGWDNFLSVGMSANPHGGIGFLEYRNLFSNYGRYAGSKELGRSLEPWNFDAFGNKNHSSGQREEFMAVDYMDLHVLKPNCGIGLHRHRDNQEVFMMLEGRGLMVIGDWNKMPERERCFEIRTLMPGSLAMLKGGQLHGLMNLLDEDVALFMFGGYD